MFEIKNSIIKIKNTKIGEPTHHQDNVVKPINFITVKITILKIKKPKPLIDSFSFSMCVF